MEETIRLLESIRMYLIVIQFLLFGIFGILFGKYISR